MIDVNRLLQLEYLNGLILEFDKIVLEEKKKFIEYYTLDDIIKMNLEDINLLFEKFDVKNEIILEFMQSSFLDETWEFAYLYSDDISYSLEEKQKLRDRALSEVETLNKHIDLENDKIKNKIKSLHEKFELVHVLIKILSDDNLILDEDVELLKKLIVNSPLLDDTDRFKASFVITKYLIENERKILARKEVVDTKEFEDMLADAYNSSSYKAEDILDDDLTKLPYYDLIMEYYERYKELFDQTDYDDILDFIVDANILSSGIEDTTDSISKEDFCIEMAGLLYQLNYIDDELFIADALSKLAKLDKLFDEDSKLFKYKQKMLKDLGKFSSMLSVLNEDSSIELEIRNKFENKIKLLFIELEKNFIGKTRREEIDLIYKNIENFINNLSENMKFIISVENYYLKIRELYCSYSMMKGDFSNKLSILQDELLGFKEEIIENGFSLDLTSRMDECFRKIDNIEMVLKNSGENDLPKEKIALKGFVLFDFDENNHPYVLSDLVDSIDNEMIDTSIQSKDLKKGYDSFCKLVRDLFIYGNTEKLANNDSRGKRDRLNEPIYWDKKRKTADNATGMYRLKYDVNGVERFAERKVVLHYGTILYQQIVDIIKEIVPNVSIVDNHDLELYVNFASAMKKSDESLYDVSIKRYKNKSLLYKLFFDDKNKDRLTDEECDLFREILKMTMNTFYELEKINSNLDFDIIRQMGEVKTRG